MIKTIHIKNFQAHKNLKLEFDKGVNVIAGQSDIGKSTIVRSFEWVRKNKPSGDSIKRWSEEPITTSVEIDTDSGKVSKERDKVAVYKQGKKEFKAVNKDVPDEIYDTLNMSDYNVQTQHQPYFLLQKSPGEVAKELNELIGLDIIDTLFKNLNSKALEAKRFVETTEVTISELETQLEAYDSIHNMSKLIVFIENNQKRVEDIQKGQIELLEILSAIEEVDEVLVENAKVLEFDKFVRNIDYYLDSFYKKTAMRDALGELFDSLKAVDSQIAEDEPWVKLEPTCIDLTNKADQYTVDKANILLLTSAINGITVTEETLSEAGKELKGLTEEYITLLKEHKTCPICKSAIGDSVIKHIKEEML